MGSEKDEAKDAKEGEGEETHLLEGLEDLLGIKLC